MLSRFRSFRNDVIRRGTVPTLIDYAGVRLNMREFYRALVIGTRKTRRMKSASTQTDHTGVDVSAQVGDQDFIETPDMSFSDDYPMNEEGETKSDSN